MKFLGVHPSCLMYSKIFLRLEPLGLESVAGVLERAGHEVQLIDLQVETHKDYSRMLDRWQPDVVGFSCNYLANVPEIVNLVFAKPVYPAVQSGEAALCETNIYAHLHCSEVPVAVTGAVGGRTPDRIELAVYGTKRSYRILQFYILEKTEGGAWQSVFPPLADPRSVSIPRQLDNVAKWLRGEAHPKVQ